MACMAAITASPIAPQPITNGVSASPMFAMRAYWTPTDRGSMRAAIDVGTWSATGRSRLSLSAKYSPNAPG